MTVRQGSGVRALLGDYRAFAGQRRWAALGLMLLGALAEGAGILMLVPIASLAIGRELPEFLRGLAIVAEGIPPEQRLLSALFLFVVAMALRSALIFARDLHLAKLLADYEASLRLRAAATLSARGWPFASRIGQAGMQTLLLSDVPRASMAVSQAQQFAVAAVMLTVQLALAALLSIRFTAAAVAILAVAIVVALRFTRRGVRSGMAIIQRHEASAGSGFRLHAGLKAALAQGTVPQFIAEYRITLASARDESLRFMRDLSLSRTLAFFGSAVAAAVLFFVGYQLIGLPFAILMTSLVLFARMAAPAQQLQQSGYNVAAYAPSFAAITGRLGTLVHAADAGPAPEPLDWHELRLDRAGFEHGPGLGLGGFSGEVRRGEWLGIGGQSGAGKTTLIDLVTGLLSPQSGTILVDGQPLEGDRLARWRAGLAYVGQEGSVFDDSVRGNLTADSEAALDDGLWQALDLVGLADRIRGFPQMLDEPVGDRGSALSGGERQRLAIARALLRKPTLLILDEATSALDLPAEAALLARLRALAPRPAALIVAHRASTLAHCDSAVTIQHDNGAEAQL